jgi:hypothetical protein
MIGKHPSIPRRGGPITGPINLHLPDTFRLPHFVCTCPARRVNRARAWHHYVITNGPGGPIAYYGGRCRDIDHGRRGKPDDPWPKCPPPRGDR